MHLYGDKLYLVVCVCVCVCVCMCVVCIHTYIHTYVCIYVYYSSDICTGDLTDMYAWRLEDKCIHISQIKSAHVTTVM